MIVFLFRLLVAKESNVISWICLFSECKVNPSPGVCTPNERRHFYSYSTKSSSCVRIYGCFSIRDRNVFLTRDGCRKDCLILEGSGGGTWSMDARKFHLTVDVCMHWYIRELSYMSLKYSMILFSIITKYKNKVELQLLSL